MRTGRLHSLQLVEAMASNTQTLDRMAELLSQAASQLKQVGHQGGRQEVEQRELAQKVGKMERINQDHAAAPYPTAKKQAAVGNGDPLSLVASQSCQVLRGEGDRADVYPDSF